jgi:hypothetical protein
MIVEIPRKETQTVLMSKNGLLSAHKTYILIGGTGGIGWFRKELEISFWYHVMVLVLLKIKDSILNHISKLLITRLEFLSV